MMDRRRIAASVLAVFFSASFALAANPAYPAPGTPAPRAGDEIVVCGQMFHTGTRVVLWTDPGGYDAYRHDMWVPPVDPNARIPNRAFFGTRSAPLTDDELAKVQGGNWTLDFLRQKVDQFVLHYDVCGTSQTCFRVLHSRGLSVHFMCDIDGTIYQTIDLKDETWHATSANGRSIGVEIANMGAYPTSSSPAPLAEWYQKDPAGRVRITIPARLPNGGGVLTPNFVGYPARNEMVAGALQGNTYRQYDFTGQQYLALAKLAATLCTVFPKIQPDYPRQKTALGQPATAPTTQPAPGDPTTRPSAIAEPEEPGRLIPHALSPAQLDEFQGILGHYHVQTDKQDPGPAFQWDLLVSRTRALLTADAKAENLRHRHQPARFVPSPPKPATTTSTSPATTAPAAR